MSRVLIIHPGYRQGLANIVSREVSFGSVLRSTALLNLFRGDEVIWVTARQAVPLIHGARNVSRVLVYDHLVSRGLTYETFDVVVNLEPSWEFCALAESVNARLRFGFSLDGSGTQVVALPGAERALAVEVSPKARRTETRPHQQILFEVMGRDWQGEPFVLGYAPESREEFDLGFNMQTPHDMPNKAWDRGHWRRLEELTFGRYSISYRQSRQNLQGYIEWVNSCRIIVTPDTLGLYLALALGKRVVALFGPTSAARCHCYGRGIKLTPSVKLNCIPCADAECPYTRSCIQTVAPDRVAEAVHVLAHAEVLEN